MSSENELRRANQETYAGFISLLKWSIGVVAVATAFVIYLIA